MLNKIENDAVTINESAVKRITSITKKEENNVILRISVNGGGCSGFQYDFTFDSDIAEDDIIIENNEARIVVDPVSMNFLKGSEVHYVNELIHSKFEIRNPNATSSCGCGVSFSVF